MKTAVAGTRNFFTACFFLLGDPIIARPSFVSGVGAFRSGMMARFGQKVSSAQEDAGT
jgi:hypothetical protein